MLAELPLRIQGVRKTEPKNSYNELSTTWHSCCEGNKPLITFFYGVLKLSWQPFSRKDFFWRWLLGHPVDGTVGQQIDEEGIELKDVKKVRTFSKPSVLHSKRNLEKQFLFERACTCTRRVWSFPEFSPTFIAKHFSIPCRVTLLRVFLLVVGRDTTLRI